MRQIISSPPSIWRNAHSWSKSTKSEPGSASVVSYLFEIELKRSRRAREASISSETLSILSYSRETYDDLSGSSGSVLLVRHAQKTSKERRQEKLLIRREPSSLIPFDAEAQLLYSPAMMFDEASHLISKVELSAALPSLYDVISNINTRHLGSVWPIKEADEISFFPGSCFFHHNQYLLTIQEGWNLENPINSQLNPKAFSSPWATRADLLLLQLQTLYASMAPSYHQSWTRHYDILTHLEIKIHKPEQTIDSLEGTVASNLEQKNHKTLLWPFFSRCYISIEECISATN